MRILSRAFLSLFLFTPIVAAQTPRLADADCLRVAEAFRLARGLGNRLWPDWDKAPFAVLLVTPDYEFLIRHPKPSEDFTAAGEDPVLKEKVWSRKRKFSPELLATFPAVGGVPTIVIGQAENTSAKTSTRWVITLLHEHFHQLQNSQPQSHVTTVSELGVIANSDGDPQPTAAGYDAGTVDGSAFNYSGDILPFPAASLFGGYTRRPESETVY